MDRTARLSLCALAAACSVACIEPRNSCDDVTLADPALDADGWFQWSGGPVDFVEVSAIEQDVAWSAECPDAEPPCISSGVDISRRLEVTGAFGGQPEIALVAGNTYAITVGHACLSGGNDDEVTLVHEAVWEGTAR